MPLSSVKTLALAVACTLSFTGSALAAMTPLSNPSTPQQWDEFTSGAYQADVQNAHDLMAQYHIKVESLNITGVPCYLFTPQELKHDNLLFFVHGGGYVLGAYLVLQRALSWLGGLAIRYWPLTIACRQPKSPTRQRWMT